MTSIELSAALETLGISRKELAERLGVHPVTVRKWMCGMVPVPRMAMLYLAAETRAGAAERERDELKNKLYYSGDSVPISKDNTCVFIDGFGMVHLDYNDELLKRAEAAEAKLAKAVEALRPFAGPEYMYYDHERNSTEMPVRIGCLRRARETLKEITEEENNDQ